MPTRAVSNTPWGIAGWVFTTGTNTACRSSRDEADADRAADDAGARPGLPDGTTSA